MTELYPIMKRMLALLSASVLIVLLAQSARAQERVLTGMGGAPTIIVWKNLQALREGTDLISSGVAKRNPALVTGLISCIVPNGTSSHCHGNGLDHRNSIDLSDFGRLFRMSGQRQC